MAATADDNKTNVFDENAASHKMDLQSRTAAALGVDTMKNLSSLTVLIIGLKGTGVETAKNLILTGPKSVTLWDDDICQIADLGANFYLTEDHVRQQICRSDACTKTLSGLNPYCNVSNIKGTLDDNTIQSFGAIVITKTLPKKELLRINNLCRTRTAGASAFILAVTHGITGHIFTDFGSAHVVNDLDGEPARALVIDNFDQDGIITVAAKRHGFDDGDTISIEDIEGAPKTDNDPNSASICELNSLSVPVKVKRIYYKYDYKRPDGKMEKRERQVFNKLRLDLTGTPLEGKSLSKWKTGGLINEVKAKKQFKFRSISDCMQVPANEGLAVFFGPQHPDQGAWEQGAGKTIHILYCTALQFNEAKGFFPRLHNEDDSREFTEMFKKINKANKDSNVDGACFIDGPIDTKRINAYSWYFATELTGYCAFLGGVAAQEVVKKFGKYTPIFQWLHCDHIQLVGNEIPSDAIPQSSRYDNQISIFGKAFQYKLSNQKIFLVGTGALGCEYLKGLSLMGVGTGSQGKVWCTDMDRIEISNLSRQFLFRANHVGKPKSTTAAAVSKVMNPSFNVEALEMKVWPETEDYFDDVFWDNLDLCWNALDNVHARKYTDNKCLLHGKPLLESGTQGTKCNSEVIIPYKTKSYNDGEEQETEGIPMCTLQNFPYLPIHCIEWARSSFGGLFETQPKTYNTFIENTDKFFEQVDTAQGEERYEIVKTIEKFIKLDVNNLYNECIKLAFDEFVIQHVTRIKNLIHLFPEDEKVKDKITGQIIGNFWTGHKKFPRVPKFDLNDPNVLDYIWTASNLWAFALGATQIRDKKKFRVVCDKLNLKLPVWKPPVGLKIKVDEDDDDDDNDDNDGDDGKENEEKEKYIIDALASFKKIDKTSLLQKMNEIEFEKDDDLNFHIDYITAVANTRARNYKIKETSRHKCKIIAGKIIAALATTTAMICGLVELEFYKLKLGLGYIHQDAFYNANINLAVSQFQFFQPDAAIRNESYEKKDAVNVQQIEKHIPYPPNWTSWDTIIVDEGNLTVQEFVDLFPQKFNGITVNLLFKKGKMDKGLTIYNASISKRKATMADNMLKRSNLSDNLRKKFTKQKADINAFNASLSKGRNDKLINRYIELYSNLVSDKRNYVILDGAFDTPNGDIADLPRIKYIFK